MEQDRDPEESSQSTAIETLRGTPVSELTHLPPAMAGALDRLRRDVERFDLEYRSALLQVEARLEVLRDEFTHLHDYNPIEHVTSRVKSPDSILAKVARRGVSPTLEDVRAEITDIAGIRVTCSFVSDVYRLVDLLTAQDQDRLADELRDGWSADAPLVSLVRAAAPCPPVRNPSSRKRP